MKTFAEQLANVEMLSNDEWSIPLGAADDIKAVLESRNELIELVAELKRQMQRQRARQRS